jgi:hypothetical protein
MGTNQAQQTPSSSGRTVPPTGREPRHDRPKTIAGVFVAILGALGVLLSFVKDIGGRSTCAVALLSVAGALLLWNAYNSKKAKKVQVGEYILGVMVVIGAFAIVAEKAVPVKATTATSTTTSVATKAPDVTTAAVTTTTTTTAPTTTVAGKATATVDSLTAREGGAINSNDGIKSSGRFANLDLTDTLWFFDIDDTGQFTAVGPVKRTDADRWTAESWPLGDNQGKSFDMDGAVVLVTSDCLSVITAVPDSETWQGVKLPTGCTELARKHFQVEDRP